MGDVGNKKGDRRIYMVGGRENEGYDKGIEDEDKE
jgi:hypothetical protein